MIDQTNHPNQTYPQPKPEKKAETGKRQPVKSAVKLVRNLLISLFVLVLLTGGTLGYTMLNPDSEVAYLLDRYTGFDYFVTQRGEIERQQNQVAGESDRTEEESRKEPLTSTTASPRSSAAISSTEELIQEVLPSVVSISVKNEAQFFESTNLVSGTGFFVSEDGLLVTNRHVVSVACNNSQAKIIATDYQNQAHEMEIASIDPTADLAILKMKNASEKKFLPVSFLPEEDLRLGMEVIAVGNAFGKLQNTVTAGIISGVDRDIGSLPERQASSCGALSTFSQGLIQTDAAINPGNSGGPLFNSEGALVGVNTYNTPSGQSVGLAIPAGEVQSILDSYLENGKVTKPFLGVNTIPISPTLQKQFSPLPVDYGALIALDEGAIVPESPAEEAGLEPGDILLSVNEQEIRVENSQQHPLGSIINQYKSGEQVEIEVLKSEKNIVRGANGDLQIRIEAYREEPETVQLTLGNLEANY